MLRHALLGLTLLACVVLVVAEFGDLNHVQILTVTKGGPNVGSHHGHSLAIVAFAAAVMAAGAWRGSRPAGFAVAALGLVALLVVLFIDLPDVDALGKYEFYEGAKPFASMGFRLDAAGAVLLLFAGVMTAVFTRSVPTPSRRSVAPDGSEGAE